MQQDWIDITLSVSVQDAESAQLLIGESSPYGIYVEDYSRLEEETREIAHIDLIDKDLLAKDREHVKIHLYIAAEENPREALAQIGEKLAGAGIAYTESLNAIQQEDWANNWKQYFHQVNIGKKMCICPSWEQAQGVQDRAVLYLEPGMAFGTGTHATTCLCMEVMEDYITPGCEVLDVGCGSGILALSALLLGAKRAEGVDIDEKAVKTARENAARNGFDEAQAVFTQGDLTEKIHGSFDVIVANIVADVIVLLCRDITAFMKEHTVLIVSGVIEPSEAQVLEAFRQCGLAVLRKEQKEDWLSFVLQKK
ncbi:MAG: 50S ribosomal protein L11 methyltransferase [Clostridia bacterium]|nr:50S ribosomal protein L11 methyltransferase [Clostridia bacterium]